MLVMKGITNCASQSHKQDVEKSLSHPRDLGISAQI